MFVTQPTSVIKYSFYSIDYKENSFEMLVCPSVGAHPFVSHRSVIRWKCADSDSNIHEY